MTNAEKNALRKQASEKALAISKEIDELHSLVDENFEGCFDFGDSEGGMDLWELESHTEKYQNLGESFGRTVQNIRKERESDDQE